jgi:hypothetical protein
MIQAKMILILLLNKKNLKIQRTFFALLSDRFKAQMLKNMFGILSILRGKIQSNIKFFNPGSI